MEYFSTYLSKTKLGKKDTCKRITECVYSHHVTRVREILLSFIEIDSNCYVALGDKTIHEVRGIRTIGFQLELGGFLVIEHMLYVLELSVNVLSFLSFKLVDMG